MQNVFPVMKGRMGSQYQVILGYFQGQGFQG